MKRFVIALISLVVSLLLVVQPFSALADSNNDVIVGDVNEDGYITTSDVLSLMIYLANEGVGNPVEKLDMMRADVDKSGELDSLVLHLVVYSTNWGWCKKCSMATRIKWNDNITPRNNSSITRGRNYNSRNYYDIV